jgi:hypothetical protein
MMSVLTLECVVERGQIRLPAHVRVPDHAKVYVLVPDVHVESTVGIARIESPRLVNPADVGDFVMEVEDAGV